MWAAWTLCPKLPSDGGFSVRAGDEGHLTAQSARPNVDSADGLCDPVVNAGIVGATTVVPGKHLKAVYVRGSVQGQPVTWLVDTGAE